MTRLPFQSFDLSQFPIPASIAASSTAPATTTPTTRFDTPLLPHESFRNPPALTPMPNDSRLSP